eukprot:NODE_605_length_5450_cov_0.733695.p5 type:complete len:101 gc:universal NODE_605_length_5450_cov_0.733695:3980-3678(-)
MIPNCMCFQYDYCDSCYNPNNFNLNQIAQSPKRKRRLARDVERNLKCDYDGCIKAFRLISHLNRHRKDKKHGKPLRTKDFQPTLTQRRILPQVRSPESNK